MSRFEKVDGGSGFEVGTTRWGDNEWYTVRLPHSCDHWVVAESPDRDAAIAEMEAFLSEAQAALAKLRQLEEP